VNDSPIATDDAYTLSEDTTGNVLNVLTNDVEVDLGDVLTITAVAQPPMAAAR